MGKDYYQTLGVNKSASQDEIKKAFRKKAHEYHPDKGGGDEAKFKEINEAYQTLKDEKKRKQYDQFGAAFNNSQGFGGGQGTYGGGFNWQDFARQAGAQGFNSNQGGFRTNINFDDIDLGDIFGDFFGAERGRRGRRQSARGSDLEYRMEISLEEAAFGAEKIVQVEKMEVCAKCQGKGYGPEAKIQTCPQCKGSGRVIGQQRSLFGLMQVEQICPTCEGSGQKPDRFCGSCHGAGRAKSSQELKIKIPAGIGQGESIKLSGQGEAGEKGAATGDLYITFQIRPKTGFKRQGYDILSSAEINFAQAALGGKIDVSTLEGVVKLKIPAGTQSGKVFRLADKGAHKLHGRGRGDQLVEVIVKTPTNLSRGAKMIFEELGGEL